MAYFLALFPKIMRVIMGQYWGNHYFSRSCWPVSTVFDTKKSGVMLGDFAHVRIEGLRKQMIYTWWYPGWWFLSWLLFSISYMVRHPNPIDEVHHFSRWLKHVKTTNQQRLSLWTFGIHWKDRSCMACRGRWIHRLMADQHRCHWLQLPSGNLPENRPAVRWVSELNLHWSGNFPIV